MTRPVMFLSAAFLATAGLSLLASEPFSDGLPDAPVRLFESDDVAPASRPPLAFPNFFPADIPSVANTDAADSDPAEAETVPTAPATVVDKPVVNPPIVNPPTVKPPVVMPPVADTPVIEQPAAEKPAFGAPKNDVAPDADVAPGDDLRKELAALRSDVKALQQTLTALESRLYGRRDAPPEEPGDLDRLARGIDASQKLAADLDTRLSRLGTDLKNAETLIGQHTNDLRMIRNGSSAREDAIMDADGNIRPEVIPTRSGKLVIVNTDPAAERILYVNGTPWRARVGRSYIWVPLGNVAVNPPNTVEPQVLSEWKKNAKTGVMEVEFRF